MNMKKKSYHHKNLRPALLTLTADIIAKEGLEKVTLRELARRLGVSRTAPYRHFKDKDTLLAAVAERKYQTLNMKLLEAFNAPEPLEQLRLMAAAYLAFAVDNYDLYNLMFSKEFKEGSNFPGLAEAADETFAVIAQTVLTCREMGLFQKADPNMLAYTFWSALHGAVTLYMEGKLPALNDDRGVFFTFITESAISGLSLAQPQAGNPLEGNLDDTL